MADYWKSNERKYCDFCKCWLSDNKASIAFHESGKRHKMNVAKRITEISRNSDKSERERQKMEKDIRKMEDAAMRSYAQDIHSRGDMTARSINTVMDVASTSRGVSGASGSGSAVRTRQVDPMRLEGSSEDEEDNRRVNVSKVAPEVAPDASLWVEGKSDDGYTYYWNVKTNESVWEPPKEGYLSYAEYERINQLAEQQQKLQYAEEAKKFRDNADEEVARYNRERLKVYRQSSTLKEKKQKEEVRKTFKTAEEAATNEIGEWQVVETKPPPAPIDWELPKTDDYYVPPVVADLPPEPPQKRFKEKTIVSLDAADADDKFSGSSAPTTFKKRKFANKGNVRRPLDD